MNEDVSFRNATNTDLSALVQIFNHYVVSGHISFDTEPTTIEERERWLAAYGTGRHQIVIAERRGRILGCTYSSPFRTHPAFATTVETSIYLDPTVRGHGIGKSLYENLLARLRTQRVHVAVAGIALPNEASIALHRKLGFEEVGTFKEYAVKHDVFISSIWFQRFIHAG